MKIWRLALPSLAVLALTMLFWSSARSAHLTKEASPMIGHMVFFTLKDNSAAGKKKLIDLCKTHLKDHEGTVYFSAGILADEFKREVNDREFDVALHLVFKDKAAHDKYQDHARHVKFIEEGKDNWKKVRVFDSLVE